MNITRRQMLAVSLSAPAIIVMARDATAATLQVYSNNGIAIDGSDPVAYFRQGAPVAGDPAITHEYSGAIWRFSTAENRDTFAASPAVYAPQYGGYCAYAVSQGYTASTVPDAWKIVDGKLYLNFSHRIQRRWERNILGFIQAADENWPRVLA